MLSYQRKLQRKRISKCWKQYRKLTPKTISLGKRTIPPPKSISFYKGPPLSLSQLKKENRVDIRKQWRRLRI
jgi:hypothetical protein